MNRMTRSAAVVAAAAAAFACGSTTFNTTWKNPEAQPLSFQAGDKVLGMVVSANEATRRGAEEALAREISARGLQGVPANSVIPDDATRDKDRAKAAAEKAGAAGVVVMRAVAKDQKVSSSPSTMYMSPYYRGFWGGGFYGYGWGMAYDPGYIRTDTILSVETLIYDLRQDKLVWAGQSQTTNPSKVDALIKELVGASAQQLRKQGLVR